MLLINENWGFIAFVVEKSRPIYSGNIPLVR
jgi:hypothetical protein